MNPIVESVADDLGFEVEAVNISETRTHVTAVPTFVIIDDDGNKLDQRVGMMPKPALESWVRVFLPA
jgi:hypothetical protein